MRLRAVGMWANLLLASILMLLVWLLLVWVGSRPALKTLVDLSPQQRSTIDPVTVELLHGLADQSIDVEFHTFFEPQAQEPQDPFQRQRVRILGSLRELTTMLLRQYAFHGGDHVQVAAHDPYGDIAAYREAAQRFAVTQTDVVVVAVRQSGRPPRHRVLSLEGDLGVVEIPALQRSSGLPRQPMPVLKDYKGEEALSSAVKSLMVTGTPVIYFLTSNSLDLTLNSNIGAGYSQLLGMLTSLGMDWRELDLRAGAVPKDATIVVVLQPCRPFSETEVRALHEYVRRGGRLFLDYAYSANPDWNVPGTELGSLFGYEIGTQTVYHLIVDPRAGPGVRGLDGSPQVAKVDLVMNPDHPITLRLARSGQVLNFDLVRPLNFTDPAPAGVRRETLLLTGPQAWLAFPGADGQPDLRAPRAPNALGQFMVGAVFDVDGQPGPDGKTQDGGVVVVTTGLFCCNAGMPLNGNLAANIFNYLSERRVLLDIRGSSYVARHLQIQQQQLDRIWLFLVLGVPGAFLLAGLFVFWRRRDH